MSSHKVILLIINILLSSIAWADAMCGPDGQFNPNDNRCWPVQSGNSAPTKRIDYWGALAAHKKGSSIYSVWNQTSETAAVRKALQNCGAEDCLIVKTFKNTCAAGVIGNNNFYVIDTGNDPKRLLSRLMSQCNAKSSGCEVWAKPVCAGK